MFRTFAMSENQLKQKHTMETISRRSALKRMGLLVAGAACMSMPALTAYENKTKKRIILYFTGTGNCLYVARELADEHTELLSIPQLVKQGRYTFEADEIGIVYPVYGHMPPNMVREFIKKAHLEAGYKFAILTYGNRKCSSVEIWDDVSRKAGCPFDYITTMIMVDNWLPNFDMNEQIKIDKHIPESLERIRTDLAAQRRWHEPVTELERQQHAGFLQASGVNPETGFLLAESHPLQANEGSESQRPLPQRTCVAVEHQGSKPSETIKTKTISNHSYLVYTIDVSVILSEARRA